MSTSEIIIFVAALVMAAFTLGMTIYTIFLAVKEAREYRVIEKHLRTLDEPQAVTTIQSKSINKVEY